MDINDLKKFEPIDGKWRVTQEIGNGAFGTVFETERIDYPDIKSALKVVSIPSSQSEIDNFREENYDLDEQSVKSYFYGFVTDFIKEFKLMSKLKGHSNIVSYEDHDVKPRENGIGWDIFIRMELLTSMNKYFVEHAPQRNDIIKLGIDICKALEVCRKFNIIHRDIKPSNIFVSPNGDFKLGDFGIARTLEKTSMGLSKKGTYSYMAPEVFKGKAYNANVDIYSLGIVMYKLLNNNLEPFRTDRTYANGEQAFELRMCGTTIPKPANADEKLAEIVLKACNFNPDDRYENPTQMREALEALLYPDAVATPNFSESNMFLGAEEKTVGIFSTTTSVTAAPPNSGDNNDAWENTSVMATQPPVYTPPQQVPVNKPKRKTKGKVWGIISIIAGGILLSAVLAFSLIFLMGGKNVRDIQNIPEEIVMVYEEQYQLEPDVIPSRAKYKIIYAIDDTLYAEVDENGLITAKSVQGSTTVTVEAGKVIKTIQLEVYAPIDAEALEESYRSAKNLLDIVNSDTSINQDDVAEAKTGMQQTLDLFYEKDIEIDDISEQDIKVLSTLETKDSIDSKTQLLLEAYEYAWDIVEQNQASASKKKKSSSGSKYTSSSSNVRYCPVCGDTSHTVHPSCVVCGSTSHSKHPVCPICASTTHTKHPQ